MNGAQTKRPPIDTALVCLVYVARVMGIPADEKQLARAYALGERLMDARLFLRAARDLGMKGRLIRPRPDKIARLPVPAVAIMKDGRFVVLGNSSGDRIVIMDPFLEKPVQAPIERFLEFWSGEVMLLTHRPNVKDLQTELVKRFNLLWFLPVFWKFRHAFLEVIGSSFLLQLLGLLTPLFFQVIIDKVLVHQSAVTLNVLCIGMLFAHIFLVGMSYLRGYLMSHTTNKIDVILSTRLYRHISALPLQFFESRRVGETVARVRELENVRSFITGTALTLVLDTFFSLVYIVAMFFYSLILSAIVLAALPLFVVLTAVFTPIIKKQLNVRFGAYAENYSMLVESVTGMQTIKALALEPQFNQKWEQSLARFINMSFTTATMANVYQSLGQLLQLLVTLTILWVGAGRVMSGELSLGQLVAFNMLAGQVTQPVLRLVNLWRSFQEAKLSIDRLGDLLNTPAEPAFNLNRTTLAKIDGDIEFDRVCFRYRPDSPDVLKQVSFSIPRGSKIGIVGASGSGKSTLMKLVQRLYVPESGRVLIDGIDTAQVEPSWLRQQIGFVLQESFLFNGTIMDNIVMGQPGVSQQAVEEAAHAAGAAEFIQGLPEGYSTQVGERGAALSGGQRQRVAIARALIAQPRILIFDEATSSLDYESERIILDNLGLISQGRTVLMIAHRLSVVRECDQILVMDRGRVAEQGTHEELMRLNGVYAGLQRQQEV